MKIKTTKSDLIWQSSDGQRTIWEVTLLAEDDNKEYRLETYSSKIAELGYEGEVRSYVNPCGDRFVRAMGMKPLLHSPSYEFSVRAQWAIGQAINLASVKMDKEDITLPVIEKYARELFATVSRVKGEAVTPEDEAAAEK